MMGAKFGNDNGAIALPGHRLTRPGTWSDANRHFHAGIDSPWYRLAFRLMAEFVHATFDFYRLRKFAPVLMPVTSGAISSPIGRGSDSQPVSVELFGAPTYLVDSMQFQLEYALRHGDDGVFYLMPTFRGEHHDTLHLNQFFHSEAELIGGMDRAVRVAAAYVTHCTRHLLNTLGPTIEAAVGTVSHMEDMIALGGSIPEVHYEDACKLLGTVPDMFNRLPDGTIMISRAGERRLMRDFGGIVWLTHLPADAVPFYQAVDAGGRHARCADLLFGQGEVVGLGERHTHADETRQSLLRHEVAPGDYEWYLRMKAEYPLQTSGFGLGVERFLAWILRHDDVRDIHLFSRLRGIESSP